MPDIVLSALIGTTHSILTTVEGTGLGLHYLPHFTDEELEHSEVKSMPKATQLVNDRPKT